MQILTIDRPVDNRECDRYDLLLSAIQDRFATATKQAGTPLFTTDVDGLFDIFLAHLPDEARQHYTCNCCRQFFSRCGGLVTIDESGKMTPAMWPDKVPAIFQRSVDLICNVLSATNVTGVFLSKDAVLGMATAGGWTHTHVVLPARLRFNSLAQSAGQAMAAKREDYQILRRSLVEYAPQTVATALTLLQGEALYRSDRVLGVAKWFGELQTKINTTRHRQAQDNLAWLAVATAPAGFCHVRSSMIGTLLDDIEAGMSFDAASRRFAEKMNPANYQRSQVAPTAGNVQQAEKLVEKFGLQNSLQRRYMTIDEIPAFVWRRRQAKSSAPSNGVFAGIATKQKATAAPSMALPVTTMTWRKFAETVLPTADRVEVKVENINRFAALVTAAHPDAENILQWNNTASWYYHGGIDAEMKRRVESAGGQYENNEIRCSLMWDGYTDLDLHCVTPRGDHIYFGNKHGRCDGWLDVDANGGVATTMTPVENIRWATAPVGDYRFYIHNYRQRDRVLNHYKAEIEVGGQVFTFEGMSGNTGWQTDLASFRYQKGVAPLLTGSMSQRSGTAWNLEIGQFYDVTGIVKSPNLWGEQPATHVGDHTFLLIDGCRDTSEGKGRGFFNEMLRPDLREIRKTLEAYTANTPIAGCENATACGLAYSKDGEWGVTLRVSRGTVVALYKLDRWD